MPAPRRVAMYKVDGRFVKGKKGQKSRYAGASARAPSAAAVQAIRKVSGEKKGLDTQLGANTAVVSTFTTNSNSFICNLVPAGAASFNRVGRKIFCKSLRIHGHVTYDYSPVATTFAMAENILRMVVIWDKQPSDAIVNWDDIFACTEQGATETTGLETLPAYDNMSRFQILRDLKIVGTIDATPAVGTTMVVTKRYHIDEYVKLGNRQSVFSGDSVPMTVADVSTGGIYVYFRAAVNSAGINQFVLPDEQLWARLRYSD